MSLSIVLACMSGIVLLEGVVVELLAYRREMGGHPAICQVGDLGAYFSKWVLPMLALSLTGGALLEAGKTLPLGTLVQASGAVLFSTFLVIFLYCMTTEPS